MSSTVPINRGFDHRLLVLGPYAGAGMKVGGPWLSGGDRITIELVRKLASLGWKITVMTGPLGRSLYSRYGIQDSADIVDIWTGSYGNSLVGILLYGVIGLLRGMIKAARLSIGEETILLSQSDFLPDLLPAYILKRKGAQTWIATFYLFAPNPFRTFVYRGMLIPRGILFYFLQKLSLLLIRKNADIVLVTNDADRQALRSGGQVVAIYGGVDLNLTSEFLANNPRPVNQYDAVFVGRFHPQKGIGHLLQVWDRVCKKQPNARLALIGIGPIESKLRATVASLRLEENVNFLGFLDGEAKLKILLASRIFVHPVIYDSGGMAAAEAMACGLPCVGFDIPSLRSYYPKGMIKVPPFDLDAFADTILGLLTDISIYQKVSAEARTFALEWDWQRRTDIFINVLNKHRCERDSDRVKTNF